MSAIAATYDTDTLKQTAEYARRPYVAASKLEWWTAFFYLLSMSMIGLKFPLGYLFVLILLINSWRKSRIDFIIQFTLLCGYYAFIGEHNFPFKLQDFALGLGILGIFIYRKPPLVRKAVIAWCVYTVSLFVLASYSEETMSIQFRTLRTWLGFIYFMVPLMVFAGKDFDIKEFMRKLVPYIMVICAFYILDAFVVNGQIFVPNSHQSGDAYEGYESSFWAPAIYGFGYFPRKYPPGLFWLALAVMPMSRYYKLRWWHWLLIVGALMAARTFTIIIGFFISYMVFQPNMGRKMKYMLALLVMLSLGYAVDSTLPMNSEYDESTLRIKSSVDQLFVLNQAQDDEDIAQTGSGRLAQAIPKFELMYHYGKEWTGLGFLHPELTKNPKYILVNDYYKDLEKNQEVASIIEVVPLQVFLYVGYIGLIIHFAFYIYLYWIVRKLRYSLYFLSALVCTFIFGLGGFAGWIYPMGLFLNAIAFSAVLLANKEDVWRIVNKNSKKYHEQKAID